MSRWPSRHADGKQRQRRRERRRRRWQRRRVRRRQSRRVRRRRRVICWLHATDLDSIKDPTPTCRVPSQPEVRRITRAVPAPLIMLITRATCDAMCVVSPTGSNLPCVAMLRKIQERTVPVRIHGQACLIGGAKDAEAAASRWLERFCSRDENVRAASVRSEWRRWW